MTKQKIAVIGYGILGIIAAEAIDKDLYEVHIFDLEQDLASPQYFKDPEGHKGLTHNFSMPIGSPGNQYHWGLGLTNVICSTSSWPQHFLDNIPKLANTAKKFGFPKISLQIHAKTTLLKIKYADRSRLLNIKKKQSLDSRIKRHFCLVERIEQKSELILVTTKNSDGTDTHFNFNYIYIAAGPIKSFELLHNSDLIPKKTSVSYFDHPTLFLGHFELSKIYLFNKYFRNKDIIFGKTPTAHLLDTDKNFRITIRVIPIHINSNRFSNRFYELISRFRNVLYGFFGSYLFKKFAVTVSFDFLNENLKAIIGSNIDSLHFEDSEPRLSSNNLMRVEHFISEKFGTCKMSWTSSETNFPFSPAAHFSGFLKENIDYSDSGEFNLKNYPNIKICSSAIFPESVPGHPTYLAVLLTLYLTDLINKKSVIHTINRTTLLKIFLRRHIAGCFHRY